MSSLTEKTLRKLFRLLFLRGRSARGIKLGSTPTSLIKRLSTVLGVYALIGVMSLSLIHQSVFVIALYLHAMTFVLLGLFVATSTGDVLFNREEGDILLHRPVDARVLLRAKISVLVQVSLSMACAFNLIGFIVGITARDGRWTFPLVHAASMALNALFCTSTVVVVYQLCLRWFGRERLDALMTATQVVASLGLVLGGQLVPQLMLRSEGATVVSANSWWVGFLPPSWFAGIDDVLLSGGSAGSRWLAVLGVSATALMVWLACSQLAGSYVSGLQLIEESSSKPVRRARRQGLAALTRVPPLRWWLRDSASRASFLLSAAYLLRDREMKLRVYPGLAPMLVMPVIMLLQRGHSVQATSFSIAFAGCYLGLVPLLAVGLLESSQQWQASDVFRLAPVAGPAPLIHGTRRAVLLMLALPMTLIVVAIVLAMGASVSQLALILPGLIALPCYAMTSCLDGRGVPLSRPTDEGKAASRGSRMFLVMLVSGLIAGISSFAYVRGWLAYLLAVECVIAIAVYTLLRARVTHAEWPALE